MVGVPVGPVVGVSTYVGVEVGLPTRVEVINVIVGGYVVVVSEVGTGVFVGVPFGVGVGVGVVVGVP